jgi:uncharacterized protein YceH (UPF0502 family)
MESEKSLHELTDIEIRVLGALMEKSKTTPDYYPMTLNSLTAACSQKTSRYPVVEYSEETISIALRNLKGIGLVSPAIGAGSRSEKFKHNFDFRYEVTEGEYALLCLLFLRGPQTPGELNTNSNRLHEFPSLTIVNETLNKLATSSPPLVKELSKRSGQKEARYIHLFGVSIDLEEQPISSSEQIFKRPPSEIEMRLIIVEKELAEVKEVVAKLMKDLGV